MGLIVELGRDGGAPPDYGIIKISRNKAERRKDVWRCFGSNIFAPVGRGHLDDGRVCGRRCSTASRRQKERRERKMTAEGKERFRQTIQRQRDLRALARNWFRTTVRGSDVLLTKKEEEELPEVRGEFEVAEEG